MRGRGTLIAIAAVGAIALGSGSANAAVSCGKVVMKDFKLRKDLLGCSADGLVAGASNITINLNGHRVDGQDLALTSGVYIPGSYTNVVLKGHGRITDFDEGVELRGDNGRVRETRLKGNVRGISVNEAADSKVRNNTIEGSTAYGVTVSHAEDVEVSDNEITGPSVNVFSSAGIGVAGSDAPNALIEDNVVRGGPEGDFGIWVFGDASGTRIKSNLFRGHAASGIDIYDGAAETVVRKNRAIGNGLDGIEVGANAGGGNRVVANTARENDDDGIGIAKAGVDVGDNIANDNGDWGIVAIAPFDLGGNRAKGNGEAAQCSGVACS
jgi:parallel beta-helix repeat protein